MKYYDVILKAYNEKYAIPQFNIINGVYAKYILEECQSNNSPVIIGVSEKTTNHMGGYNEVKSIIEGLKKDLNLTIPVILHLDHGKSIESCEKAINAGYDSVMLDFSLKEIEENISSVKYLKEKYPNTIIECEMGHVGNNGNEGIQYAEVNDVKRLSEETASDLIAPAIGNVHGPYKGEPNINFELLNEINEVVKKPLVMHGGSGLSEEVFKKSIENGISKININTELKKAWSSSIRKFLNENQDEYDPVIIERSTEESLKNVVRNIIRIFGSVEKA